MATYDNGDQVRVTGTFTTAGTLADPTGDAAGITITWRKPSGGTDATPAATKSSTGVYYVDVTLNEVGVHTIKFQGEEGVIAASIVELEVQPSVFD